MTVSDSPASNTNDPANHERLCAASVRCRDQFWSAFGEREQDVITYLMSPEFMGRPAWPTTRQAFTVVRTPRSIIIATDGLSDPFLDGEDTGNGYQMELFIETGDIAGEFAGTPGDVDPLKRSWAFVVLEQAAALVADTGGILHL